MNELNKLIEKISQAKDAYYNSGRTIMSDLEYDQLVDKAAKLGYIETVGSKPISNLPEIRHEHLMLSLDKAHTADEVIKFSGEHPLVAMYKADGLTISATYENGVLTRLETRGNGEVGNDIMVHAKSFENLPLTIDYSGRFVVDGEAVILYEDFEKINAKLPDDQKYKNPRNLAAGTLNLLDPTISKTRHLRFYVWDVMEGSGNFLFNCFADAAALGFSVISHGAVSNITSDNFDSIVDCIKNDAREQGFPIDGVVFKYNDLGYGRSLGYTEHHGRGAIAYKYEDERFPSKLRSVTWQVGKTGKITPVAEFDTIKIDGTDVCRASMHNISIMKQLNPKIGCTCYVAKKNQIIPQIELCDEDGNQDIVIPDICPICGGKTMITKYNQSEELICTNQNCPGKLLGKLKYFVSKKGMDIDGLSEATLEKFINLGWLGNFLDIYKLNEHYQQIVNLDGFGKKSADKLISSIYNSRDVKLTNFITALSIPGIGEGQTKLICKKYPTWKEFYNAAHFDDFSQIDGIGEILNKNIHDWFVDVNNDNQAVALSGIMHFAEINFMNKPEISNSIEGLTFVVTGSVNHFKNRDELKTKIEELGGKCAGSVSKKTDYLINNDVNSTSGKNQKARDLGVKIISEAEFLEMIK